MISLTDIYIYIFNFLGGHMYQEVDCCVGCGLLWLDVEWLCPSRCVEDGLMYCVLVCYYCV